MVLYVNENHFESTEQAQEVCLKLGRKLVKGLSDGEGVRVRVYSDNTDTVVKSDDGEALYTKEQMLEDMRG